MVQPAQDHLLPLAFLSAWINIIAVMISVVVVIAGINVRVIVVVVIVVVSVGVERTGSSLLV